jgi:hypothetical protein
LGIFLIKLQKRKVRVISIKKLPEFWGRHADCEQQLRAWYQEASKAAWKNGNEILKEFPRVRCKQYLIIMKIKPIKSEKDYKQALERLEEISLIQPY